MTTIPTIVEVNCTTGEITERPCTAEEIQAREEAFAQFEQEKAQKDAEEASKAALKNSAKAKLIAGEPLTEEEATVLIV